MATKAQTAVANATSRNRGAVGANALVPRKVRELIPKGHLVLDFGAGKHAAHAQALRADGWRLVDAHEFGDNVDPELHLGYYGMEGKAGHYDCVYASNVLNVQGDRAMMLETLHQVAYFMHHRAVFICNYPASPRKSTMKAGEVIHLLESIFQDVDVVGGNQAPVFVCKGKRG